jgi:uncharacterized membrane protein
MTLVVVFSPLFLVIDLVALVFGIVTIVDMARRPTWEWRQAGSNKALWLVFEILFLLVFSVVSIVIGIMYFAVTRPKLLAVESRATGGGTSGWIAPAPGGGPPPGTPWSPYPPPHQPGEPGSAPPVYPGGGPPPYPGSAPEPVGVGSTPGSAPWAGPSPAPPSNPPFGWYPDPSGHHEQRYWDGTRWTEYVSDAGRQTTDPLPT